MNAIIMAGGFGSRLRPLTNNLPKPMVPIINKPIIEYIVELLRRQGITDIAMTLGYKADKIMDYFGDGSSFGVSIRYFVEETPLGTAGSVKACGDFIVDRTVVISGDAFTNIDIGAMLTCHQAHGGLLTMAVKYMEDTSSFGVVNIGDKGRILAFVEKPKFSPIHTVNTGIYIMEKALLDYIPDGKFDFSRDLFPLVMDNLRAYPMSEYWSDIGTLSSYYLTNNDVCLHPQEFGLTL